ncbi:MAG: hypothetical protein HY298_26190 [Verrucomicrobia bacterium]|nr:hypothetical protein [Verrucomicrobiota bacterium]
MKILKETCPLPRDSVRRAPATAAALYMLQLRSHVLETTSPKFRLTVSVEPANGTEFHPQPVKIIHR